MDHNVPAAITSGLRARSVDCLTAVEDGTDRLADPDLLRRATSVDRVLFTMDDDLLTIASEWMRRGTSFAGVIYAHPLRITIGQAVRDLELISKLLDPTDIADRIEYLPL
jgi:Domain of unknown function (DUF5615)